MSEITSPVMISTVDAEMIIKILNSRIYPQTPFRSEVMDGEKNLLERLVKEREREE